MKAKRQIESSLNSVTMLDGTGGHVMLTPVNRLQNIQPNHSLSMRGFYIYDIIGALASTDLQEILDHRPVRIDNSKAVSIVCCA
jgi:hypothetical protein